MNEAVTEADILKCWSIISKLQILIKKCRSVFQIHYYLGYQNTNFYRIFRQRKFVMLSALPFTSNMGILGVGSSRQAVGGGKYPVRCLFLEEEATTT